MPISALSNNTNSAGAAPAAKSALGKDDFLKLLMAQLGNQDPTAPMDSKDFVAQLAQFANVEQLQAQSQSLDALLMAQTSNNQLQAAGLVGKDAVFKSDTVHYTGSANAPLTGTLDAEAQTVTVTIKDSKGNTVRTMQLGQHAAGLFDGSWDGRNDKGVPVAPGDYSVSITAADKAGKSVGATTLTRSRITGVSFASGYAELLMGDQRVKLADVIQVMEPATAGALAAASPLSATTALTRQLTPLSQLK